VAALDGSNWCQLVALLAAPVIIWLAHGWRRSTDAHLRAVESHLADLRNLAKIQSQQASISRAVVEEPE